VSSDIPSGSNLPHLTGDAVADGTAVVGVIGLGYVGLPLCTEVARAGYRVIGFDVNADVVASVNRGESHIADVESALLSALVGEGLISATVDMSRIAECDAISICVPTPLSKIKDPDLSYVLSAARAILPHLQQGPGHHPGEHELSGDDAGGRAPHPGGERTSRRRRLFSLFQPGARGPRQPPVAHPEHAEGHRRYHAGMPRGRDGALPPGLRYAGARGQRRGGGAGEGVREHLPHDQHRTGQRAGAGVRAPRRGRLVGGGRGGHEAVRLHEVHAWSRASAATASPWTRTTCPGRCGRCRSARG
jgi:hypothetical protein